MAKQLERDAPAEEPLYDLDFYTWCMEQAHLARERRFEVNHLPCNGMR